MKNTLLNKSSIIFLITILLLSVTELSGNVIYKLFKGYWIWDGSQPFIAINDHFSLHHRPDSKIVTRNFKDLLTDENGLIKTRNGAATGQSVRKVLVIGGSTVAGIGGSGNDHTIPSRIAACLTGSQAASYQVVNAGRSAMYSYTSFRLLAEKFIPELRPDIVVQINGRNDIHYALGNESNEGKLPHADLQDNNLREFYNAGSLNVLLPLRNLLSKYSILYHVAKKLSVNGRPAMDLSNASFNQRVVENAVSNYVSISASTKSYLEARGIAYFHFLQPTLYFRRIGITAAEKSYLARWEKAALPLYGRYTVRFYEAAGEATKESLGDATTDLSSMFDGMKQELYVDSVHYNDLGNDLIARKVCDRIFASGG
jgi:lysophospholipase L1-like esterase